MNADERLAAALALIERTCRFHEQCVMTSITEEAYTVIMREAFALIGREYPEQVEQTAKANIAANAERDHRAPGGGEDAFWCSCGSGWAVPADEDGCCTSCGATLWTTADVLKCGALAADRERVARLAQEDYRDRVPNEYGRLIEPRPWAEISKEAT